MDVEGRNGCMSHKQCLDNVRVLCDNDPGCYGVSWYPGKIDQPIKLCLSRYVEPKHDGWRTMMKSGGNYILISLNFNPIKFNMILFDLITTFLYYCSSVQAVPMILYYDKKLCLFIVKTSVKKVS